MPAAFCCLSYDILVQLQPLGGHESVKTAHADLPFFVPLHVVFQLACYSDFSYVYCCRSHHSGEPKLNVMVWLPAARWL